MSIFVNVNINSPGSGRSGATLFVHGESDTCTTPASCVYSSYYGQLQEFIGSRSRKTNLDFPLSYPSVFLMYFFSLDLYSHDS
jgi:hypothetical protein